MQVSASNCALNRGFWCYSAGVAKPRPTVTPEVREYFRQLAASSTGPSEGGKARAKKLSSRRRKEIAKAAANARWKDKPRKRPG
jgi:hypothetical protein